MPPSATIAASRTRSARALLSSGSAGAPTRDPSSTPITWKDWKRPLGKRTSAVPSARGVAKRTPATLLTRSSAEAGMFVVCSTDETVGSMTHTSVSGFSEMSEKARVMNPVKKQAA